MMKDQQIQQLFDNYAQELAPQTHLAQKAVAMASAHPKRKRVAWWKPFVAVCSVFVFLVVCGVTSGIAIFLRGKPLAYETYDFATVKGRSVSREQVESAIPNAFDNLSEYSVISEQYNAFYFTDSDTLAYVKGVLGISTKYGVVEVKFIAESEGYVREDLKYLFTSFINKMENAYIAGGVFDNGEYVNSAYYKAHGFHFYVNAMGNNSTRDDVDQILTVFA